MTATAKTLVSSLARFVQGDIKGGEHAHSFRKETITHAIEQMFKGNYSPITEAASLTEGKAKKARAYHAGFATFGVIGEDTKKVAYSGALTLAGNAGARDQIASQTKVSAGAFFAAFDAVMAEKPVKKAAPVKAEAAPAPTPAPAQAPETESVQSGTIELDTLITTAIAALNGGMVDADLLEALGDAVRAAEGRASLVHLQVEHVEAATAH